MRQLFIAAVLATSALAAPASAALLVNGGFETAEFTGWDLSGDLSFTGIGVAENGFPVAEGEYIAFFGSIGGTTFLNQTVATDIGEAYTLTFKLGNLGGTPSSFSVSLGDVLLASQTDAAAFDYTDFSFTHVATSAFTTLAFTFTHLPSYYYMDAVSLELAAPADVPEPAMLALFGLGALGLGLTRRRRVA